MKLLYFLISLVLLVGCSSKKKLMIQTNQKKEYVEQKDVQEHKTKKQDSVGLKFTEIVQSHVVESETETTTKIIEYDSSQPVDPATGRPPVLRETESTTRTQKKAKEDTAGKQAENSVVSNKEGESKIDNSQSHKTEDDSEKLDQDKEHDFFQIPWLWLTIGGIGVLIVGYCIKKKVNPIKWFFPK